MRGIEKVEVGRKKIGAAFMECILWNPESQRPMETLHGESHPI